MLSIQHVPMLDGGRTVCSEVIFMQVLASCQGGGRHPCLHPHLFCLCDLAVVCLVCSSAKGAGRLVQH